jgi:C4-dicarboxylate-specific signal transduction histidine kinase
MFIHGWLYFAAWEFANTPLPSPLRMQPFFTNKPNGEGRRLGSSLSYDTVMKEHGGQIFLDTQEGSYTTFNILLPLS